MPKPAGVRRPRFSLSAICQICRLCTRQSQLWRLLKAVMRASFTSPSTSGGSRVFSKNLTATSPVTTPILSVSAWEKSWPKRRRSSGLRCRFGCSKMQLVSYEEQSKAWCAKAADLRCCNSRCWLSTSVMASTAIYRGAIRSPGEEAFAVVS